MGYRSNVVIIVDQRVWPFTLLANIKMSEIFADADRAVKTASGDYVFEYDWVKWYEEFPEVQKVKSFFNWIDKDVGKPWYGYARLGENMNDVELLGDPWEYGIEIVQQINYT